MDYKLPVVRESIIEVLKIDILRRTRERTRMKLSVEICERVERENPSLYRELCSFADDDLDSIACGCFVYEILRREYEAQSLEKNISQ